MLFLTNELAKKAEITILPARDTTPRRVHYEWLTRGI